MQTLKKEMVNFRTVVKLPKVAGILRGYVNTNIPDSGIFQTGLSFGIHEKDVKSLTVPIKNSYEDVKYEILMVVHYRLIKTQINKLLKTF